MRSYVIATGVIFALLALVHVWRMIEEPHLARDPWFILVTLVAAAFSVGAWRVSVKQSHR
jgi:heme A synthase